MTNSETATAYINRVGALEDAMYRAERMADDASQPNHIRSMARATYSLRFREYTAARTASRTFAAL
jgi:hypothetical protein